MNPTEAELSEPIVFGYSSETAGYALQDAVYRRGLNAEEIAWKLAIPTPYMVSLLQGKEFVGEGFLRNAANALNYTPGQILSLTYFIKPVNWLL